MISAFRSTWLIGVILLLSDATGWAQVGNSSTAAQKPLIKPRTSQRLPGPTDDLLATLESIYKDIHANPELSMQEERTAGIAAEWLRQYGYEVTEKVGRTGVVGLLRNGEGATVLLRADMDALPMKENSGLPYASTKAGKGTSGEETPIAHSCGHDMHVTWLMGTTRILAENRDKWRGTIMAVFQPAEETGEGSRAMIEDGMVKRFPKPDIALAQHVMSLPAGRIAIGSARMPRAAKMP
jgi:hippurate hydrolase